MAVEQITMISTSRVVGDQQGIANSANETVQISYYVNEDTNKNAAAIPK